MGLDIQPHTRKLLHIRGYYSSTTNGYAADSASSFAINYLFLSDSGNQSQVELVAEPFDARTEQNDYEVCYVLVISVPRNEIFPVDSLGTP